MYDDIFTKDLSMDKEEIEACYALLCKYLVEHIDTINEGNLKEHVAYWIVSMLDDGVNEDQVKKFKEQLRGYIPNALY